MDLFYWKSPQGNFGDDLNEWLWDELLPGWRGWDPGVTLVGVGTIFNDVHFPKTRPGRFLVLGSGVGYGAPPTAEVLARSDIRALRGPRSARQLGLPESIGIIDPAMMIPRLATFRSRQTSGRPIFVPHVSSVERHPWTDICAALGIDHVSPCGDAAEVIRRIAAAPLVIAESMHAVILADAFRVPWRAVSVSESFNREKWMDWGDSLGVSPDVRPLLPVVEQIMNLRPKAVRPAAAPQHGAPLQVGQADGVQGAAGEAAAVPRQPPLKRRLRLGLERSLLPRALKQQLSLSPQLSRAEALEDGQARYQAMLEGVRRDFG